MEYCLCLLVMFSLLRIGQGLNLEGKTATQSSTHDPNSDRFTASKAIDGDKDTTTHTAAGQVSNSNKWWMVDLEQTYCLRKITVVNRVNCCGNRLLGAVVRAGLSSNYPDNTAIGSPVNSSQARTGAVIDFKPADRFVTARYVSVDLTNSTQVLSVAEVRIEELMNAAGASTVNGIDFTVVTFPPLLGQTGNDDAFIGTYKTDYDVSADVSYGRQVITGGTNGMLPTGSELENGPSFYCPYIQLNLPQEGGIDRVGVFYSQANKQDLTYRIQTIILHQDGYIRPSERTLTVNVGDDITLRMEDIRAPNTDYRWKHNNDAMDEWDNNVTVTIHKVTAEHAGIYSCFIAGQESERLPGIMRLIVRDCPSGLWGPPSCLNVCRRCYNGGICDDVTGRCICAPGLSGNNCETVHGRNIFGIDAGSSCSGKLDQPHNDACRGRLFCQRDPYGCSCAAGYTGLDCNQECTEGMYGADCKQTCNCASGTCKKDTGECDNGCQSPYFGSNCQCSTERGLLRVHVIPDSAVQLYVSWSHDSCATGGYRLQYQLTNTGLCRAISSQEPTNMDFNQPISSHTINGLVMHSTYNVSVRPIYNGDMEGPAVTATGVTFNRADSSLPMMSLTEDSHSITVTWAPDLCVIHTVEYALRNPGGCQSISEPTIDYIQHCMCDGTSSTTTISDLVANSLYTVKLTLDIPGGNPPVVTQDITTGEGAPTNPPPVNLTTTIMQRNLSFSWSELPCEDRGGVIIGYSYKLDQTGFGTVSENTTTGESVTINGLIPFTEYSFQVAAMTAVGTGPFSGSLVNTTLEAAPTVPLNVSVTKVNDVSIEVQWSEPYPPHGRITRYSIRYGRLGNEDNKIANVTELTYRVVQLEFNVTYTIEIRAWTSVGPGPWSQATMETTRVTYPPQPGKPMQFPNENTATTVTIGLENIFLEDNFTVTYIVRVKKIPSPKTRRAAFIPTHHEDSPDDYITAAFTKDDTLPNKFQVGDSLDYGGYFNAPLLPGSRYEISAGAVNTIGMATFSKSFNVTTKHMELNPGPKSPGGVIAGVLIAILVVVIAVIGIVVYRRRRAQPAEKSRQLAYAHSGLPMDIRIKDKVGDEAQANPECSVTENKDGENGSAHPPPPAAKSVVKSSPKKASRPPPPIPADKLEAYIHRKQSAGDKGFKADYMSLGDEQLFPWTVATKPENKTKNRYANVTAYDHSRVVLKALDNDPHSDYINACYIDGYTEKKKYIASQGPNKASLNDIWRMVWQLNVDIIVMLTNPVENGKMKCLQYWPDSDHKVYADISVTMIKADVYLDYTVRTFDICQVNSNESARRILQFHYTIWPDMKPPEYPTPLLNFIRVINTHQTKAKTVVHCSAGVGRTGTYICLDSTLEQMKKEGRVDVLGFIHKMRQNRIKTVQTLEQYEFIFDALLEYHLTGNTTYDAADFRFQLASLKKVDSGGVTGISSQFLTLGRLSKTSNSSGSESGLLEENADKNRFPDFIPPDKSRPFLMTRIENATNYINATFLPGYRSRNLYAATQMPKPNTVTDLWRLVWDHRMACIVMLNPLDTDDDTIGKYWPDEGAIQFGPLVVELVKVEEYENVIGRFFTLSNSAKSEPSRDICQFEVQNWPSDEDVPRSFDGILSLIELTKQWQKKKKPIVVHCIDGLGRTAVFCALRELMEQYTQDKTVDVFQAVRRLQIVNGNMMYSLEQYTMCYDVLQRYLDSFNIYENY